MLLEDNAFVLINSAFLINGYYISFILLLVFNRAVFINKGALFLLIALFSFI